MKDKKGGLKAYDHVFWSCDGDRKRHDGYLEPDGENSDYADQERIFQDVGKGLLDHLFQGFNCTLFAYGQTGSGKSYTIMERGVNKGILPRMTDSIFEIANNNYDQNIEYQVSFSMAEIYNEKVYDLFTEINNKQNGRKALKIENSKAKDLSCFPVANSNDIAHYLEKGYKNRSIASTNMNEYSSRAHTIATIYLAQISTTEKSTLKSQINIVDLAGSERAAKTGAKGTRLEEGGKINKSLMHLGTVIRELAKQNGPRQAHIYRNSNLTMLLKDSLGGNSKTVMVATVSPLDSNLEETKSTLQYAFEASRITNKCEKNKFEALLSPEVEALIGQLDNTKAQLNKVTQEKLENDDIIKQLKSEIERLRKELQETLNGDKANQELTPTVDERISTVPHLLNLNEDHMLSKLVRVYIKQDQIIIIGGKMTDAMEGTEVIHVNDIGKIGQISNKEGLVVLQTFRKNVVAVNGVRIGLEQKDERLKNGDRLMFGSLRSLWIFVDPTSTDSNQTLDTMTYETAEDEIILQTNTEEIIPADSIALRRKIIKRDEEVKEANFKAVLSNKPLVFSLALTTAYFLGIQDESNVVIVKVWNRSNNCRYIWNEDKFLREMDYIYAFKTDGENDTDPFYISPDGTFTPVGISFVDINDLGNAKTIPKCYSNLYDECANKIGQLRTSFKITGVTKPSELIGSKITITICIESASFVENLKEKYAKVKCSFRLPNTNCDNEDTEELETNESAGEAPIFNFTKQWEISNVTNEHINFFQQRLIVRLWGIPRPTDLFIERGDLAEVVEILEQKDEIIENLRKERDELKATVKKLTRTRSGRHN